MNATDITKKAMLAYVSITGWSATKFDKKASGKVTSDAGAIADSARVNKKLLAGADAKLSAVRKHAADARRYLDTHTLPWDDAGNRLLPNHKAMDVIATLAEMQQQYSEMVDDFVSEYPVLRAQALHALGDLADHSDYPPPDRIAEKFVFRASYTPIPGGFSDDVRYGLTDAERDALHKFGEARAKQAVNRAIGAAYGRLLETVQHMHDRLKPGDDGKYPVFRDSTVTNVRDTVEMLKDLNVFGDPDLEDMRQRVLNECCVHQPDTLRQFTTVRDNVAEAAQRLTNEMLKALEGL